MTKITYLKDVTFDFEEENGFAPHVSYTTPSVGGAASGLNQAILFKSNEDVKITPETLDILKAAKEIRIEMSMEEFLRKFFDLWYDDAAILAKLLGFESSLDSDEEDSYEDYIEEKLSAFTILKSLKEGKSDFFNLDCQDQIAVLKVQELFEKRLSEGTIPNTEASNAGANAGVSVEKHNNPVGDKMTDKTVELETLQKSLSDLQKALDTERKAREALEAKEEARIEKAFIEKAQGYAFVEDADAFGKLLKGMKEEDAVTVLAILEKANEAIKNADANLFKQVSVTGEAEDKETIEKAKEATRAALKKQLNLGE